MLILGGCYSFEHQNPENVIQSYLRKYEAIPAKLKASRSPASTHHLWKPWVCANTDTSQTERFSDSVTLVVLWVPFGGYGCKHHTQRSGRMGIQRKDKEHHQQTYTPREPMLPADALPCAIGYSDPSSSSDDEVELPERPKCHFSFS